MKKPGPNPGKKKGRPPTDRPLPGGAIHVRGVEAWSRYVRDFATERGLDVSALVEEAILWYATHLRRDPPPDRKGGK